MFHICVVGDDEQSDWFGDVGGAVGGSRIMDDSDRDEDMDSTFQAILSSNNLTNDFGCDSQSRICRFGSDGLVSFYVVIFYEIMNLNCEN